MVRPLVVGVYGSDASFLALDWAVDEAALHELPLRLVYASRWERYEDAALGLSLKRPAGEVLAGLLLGSVGLAVAGRARCPVIVVRGDKAGLAGTPERVLLGVGDSAKGSEAVRFAFREAAVRGCTLDAVRAWRCPAHETTDHPLLAGDPERYHEGRASAVLDEALEETAGEYPTVRVRRATVEGPAHKVLMQRSAAADLLVIGAQRRDSHLGLHLGRVAHTAAPRGVPRGGRAAVGVNADPTSAS